MKARARFVSSCTLLTLVLLIYVSSAGLRIRYRKAVGLLPDRIVVFGDDNSGIPDIPAAAGIRSRSSSFPVRTWAESLCGRIQASCVSFAPAELAHSANAGAAVDNVIFNSTAPDLRSQVSLWIAREKKLRKSGSAAERSSMFAVFFGINDIWKYSSYDEREGERAVEASLDSMFEQLRRVAANWQDAPQVLIPNVFDVTMLPAWTKQRVSQDKVGAELRAAVHLAKKWNKGLELRASNYGKFGSIMLWDCNRWFINTWRNGGWKEVRKGCVQEGGGPCERPDTYLMWDDIHLGPRAHEQMAKEISSYLM